MKFSKKQTLPLHTPKAKMATHFIPTPVNVGGFAIIKQEYYTRGKVFRKGDLVRISFNQRYTSHPDHIQITSIADEQPRDRAFMGNQYVFPVSYLKNITRIPPKTIIRLMSKNYLPPVLTRLTVLRHTKHRVVVEYEKQTVLIDDQHIEGMPSTTIEEVAPFREPSQDSDSMLDESLRRRSGDPTYTYIARPPASTTSPFNFITDDDFEEDYLEEDERGEPITDE